MSDEGVRAVFALVLIALAPIPMIWGLNTLFITNIPYDFKTYGAALFFCLLLGLK